MPVPKILVVENDLLLGASIEMLLADENELQVIGITPKNKADLVQAIWQIRPDSIILSQASHIADGPSLLARFPDHWRFQVITVSPFDNAIDVFDKKRILTTHVGDLVTTILNGRHRDTTLQTSLKAHSTKKEV